jgi:hypothetical protein
LRENIRVNGSRGVAVLVNGLRDGVWEQRGKGGKILAGEAGVAF